MDKHRANPAPPHTALTDDVWALRVPERKKLMQDFRQAQRSWLPRLRAMVEPPLPADDFPAFLLELPAFRSLKLRIGSARERSEIDTATADELQHFVDRYRDWLAAS
jgi:hypothetical protein